eukprot:270891-Pleurochrysis_carterae.AAC.2
MKELESYSSGRGEDGAPLNDSVEEEWTLSLSPPNSASFVVGGQAALDTDAGRRKSENSCKEACKEP